MSSARGSHMHLPLRELLPLTPTTAAASTLLALLWSFFLVVITTPSYGSAAKDNGDWLGDAAQYGPFYMPIAEFREQMARPNATGRYPLPGGPDMSVPYPSGRGGAGFVAAADPGWSWTISVVADIEMPRSDVEDPVNQTFTGAKLTLQAPTTRAVTTDAPGAAAAAVVVVDDSWLLCIVQFDMDIYDIPARFRQDDGSCSSVLSQQCVRAIEAETARLYTSSFDLRTPCHCPDLEKISACGAEEVKILRSGGICEARGKVFPSIITPYLNYLERDHTSNHFFPLLRICSLQQHHHQQMARWQAGCQLLRLAAARPWEPYGVRPSGESRLAVAGRLGPFREREE